MLSNLSYILKIICYKFLFKPHGSHKEKPVLNTQKVKEKRIQAYLYYREALNHRGIEQGNRKEAKGL